MQLKTAGCWSRKWVHYILKPPMKISPLSINRQVKSLHLHMMFEAVLCALFKIWRQEGTKTE